MRCKKCNSLIEFKTFRLSNIRLICNSCHTIYINNGNPLIEIHSNSLFNKFTAPECFTNYDFEDKICLEHCFKSYKCARYSPPTIRAYFHSTSEQVEKKIITCQVCGLNDTGKFCSNCGSPLTEKKEAISPLIEAIKIKLIDVWPNYFRTVYATLVNPSKFFAGAFSSQNKRFHFENKTLSPVTFFIQNITFLALLTLITEYLLRSKYFDIHDFFSLEEIYNSLLDFAYNFLYIFIPNTIILTYIKRNLKSLFKFRRYDLNEIGQINSRNIINAFFYGGSIEILLTPINVLILSALLGEYEINDNFLYFILMPLSTAAKMLHSFITLPKALQYSCQIPVIVGRKSISQLYKVIFTGIYAFIKIIKLMFLLTV
jgi:hypothetical protein